MTRAELIDKLLIDVRRIAASRELPQGEPAKGYWANIVTQEWARAWIESFDEAGE